LPPAELSSDQGGLELTLERTSKSWRLSPSQAIACLLMLSWLAFLIADYKFHLSVDPTSQWPASELYGPLGFFQPLLKYTTFALTLAYLARGRKAALKQRGKSTFASIDDRT
jgi:hypothetical protein